MMDMLVTRMQANYKAIDSFGYETIEGIVAGIPSLSEYDIYLDAGVPASEGPDNVVPVVLVLGRGEKIDKQARYSLISSSRAVGRRQALGVASGRRKNEATAIRSPRRRSCRRE
jgi:hypothetical protein